ncbi:hypothetical protein [uncultured Pseudacidovorax sp.]|uniref:hypothetical protein n=1 Tax=uncultured Pseudacidovorax sp. TaxID=679313 RepID=UPI0025D7D904|nr:hypothetical protein [uncultured Pseudacidovorax sp.]
MSQDDKNTPADAFRFPTADNPQAAEKVAPPEKREPDEAALDEGIEQSFPASDPVSVTVSPPPRKREEHARRPVKGLVVSKSFALIASAAIAGLAIAAISRPVVRRRLHWR